jgi:hypothetical protein
MGTGDRVHKRPIWPDGHNAHTYGTTTHTNCTECSIANRHCITSTTSIQLPTPSSGSGGRTATRTVCRHGRCERTASSSARYGGRHATHTQHWTNSTSTVTAVCRARTSATAAGRLDRCAPPNKCVLLTQNMMHNQHQLCVCSRMACPKTACTNNRTQCTRVKRTRHTPIFNMRQVMVTYRNSNNSSIIRVSVYYRPHNIRRLHF